ncbi:hypothetical protein ACFSL4_01555 [Streptomyces caeni]|uniref:Uncharacterized protein n=1 Tax=Streptomyces caeni TaxID=2307231 RepID=A0ABW4IJM9_9ACTN
MSVLSALALGLVVSAITGVITKRLRFHQGDGLMAIAFALWGLNDLRGGRSFWALFDAACCAFYAYGWWHGGGGDGTRRRLRRLRRRFQGVRRTAPATT